MLALQEAFNEKRQEIWCAQEESFRRCGVIDVDGTIAETLGECKKGMDISYNGIWGYHPLIVRLSNTREPLYLVNRSGNKKSNEGADRWIDLAIDCVGEVFEKVQVRGDIDFSMTKHFDRWDEKAEFIFGYKAHASVVERADALPESAAMRTSS